MVKVGGVLGPVYHYAPALQLRAEPFQVISQMGDGVALDLTGLAAQLFPFGQPEGHIVALLTDRPEGGVVPGSLVAVCVETAGRFGM